MLEYVLSPQRKEVFTHRLSSVQTELIGCTGCLSYQYSRVPVPVVGYLRKILINLTADIDILRVEYKIEETLRQEYHCRS